MTTSRDFDQYKIEPEAFWEPARIGDGYDTMDVAAARGWRTVSGWGRDGWDLGQWPYVVVYFRERDGAFETAECVEGDAYVRRFPTDELRNAYVDTVAFWYWRHAHDASWVEGFEDVDELPKRLRGPFSWARLDAEPLVNLSKERAT